MHVCSGETILVNTFTGITTKVHQISVNRNQLFFTIEITAFLIHYQLIINYSPISVMGMKHNNIRSSIIVSCVWKH